MTLRLITAPEKPPVDVEELQRHLNITSEDDDQLLESYILAATALFDGKDGWLDQALMPQTWEYLADSFPCGTGATATITIPLRPIISVTSVVYTDGDSVEQTVDAANYTVDVDSVPPRIVPVSTYSWPTAATIANAVRVRFVAGYEIGQGSDPALPAVPENIRVAIMMTVASFYGSRGDDSQATQMEIPLAAKFLLRRPPVFA